MKMGQLQQRWWNWTPPQQLYHLLVKWNLLTNNLIACCRDWKTTFRWVQKQCMKSLCTAIVKFVTSPVTAILTSNLKSYAVSQTPYGRCHDNLCHLEDSYGMQRSSELLFSVYGILSKKSTWMICLPETNLFILLLLVVWLVGFLVVVGGVLFVFVCLSFLC